MGHCLRDPALQRIALALNSKGRIEVGLTGRTDQRFSFRSIPELSPLPQLRKRQKERRCQGLAGQDTLASISPVHCAAAQCDENLSLPAVSAQFKACRDVLASDLRAVGAEVAVQEDFQQHGGTLAEKLQKYISGCDRVIALVGDAYGWEPEPGALPAGKPRRSYTQWEYFFAQGERLDGGNKAAKETFVYFASANFLASNPVSQPAETTVLQQEFIAEICSSGKDRNPFSSLHELRALVLRDGFRLGERKPPPQNLPYPSLGNLFKGRENVFFRLRQSLVSALGAHATAIVGKALHGLGGVGKTRLAVEYAWQHEQDYSALLFLVADSESNLRRNLAALAGPLVLNLPENQLPEEEARIAAALRWLDQHPGWLLILDNVDTAEAAAAAEDLLARLRGGHVLMTSRISQWSGSVEALELDVLDPDEGGPLSVGTNRARPQEACQRRSGRG